MISGELTLVSYNIQLKEFHVKVTLLMDVFHVFQIEQIVPNPTKHHTCSMILAYLARKF